jgi:hypothetical protein
VISIELEIIRSHVMKSDVKTKGSQESTTILLDAEKGRTSLLASIVDSSDDAVYGKTLEGAS